MQAVRDEDHGLARAPPDVEQPLAHQDARLLVERAEGLVHQEDLRVERERAPDRDALLHPARELARILLGEAGEAERAQELGGRPAPPLGRHALELEAELDVLERGPPRKEAGFLEHGRDAAGIGPGDRPAIDHQAALVGRDETAEHAEQRGLAASGGADQGAERALFDRERDVLECFHRARAGEVALGDALDDDQLGARAHVSWRISRAMTRRWISEVPSPISVSFASRKMRSTGNSVM